MQDQVGYEWGAEFHDEHQDCAFFESLADVLHYIEGDTRKYSLVLVRSVGNDFDGVTGRSWAYVENGTMPQVLLDAFQRYEANVPKRYLKEFAKVKTANSAAINAAIAQETDNATP